MKNDVVYLFFVNAGVLKRSLDVARNLADDKVKHVAATHIALLITADIAVLIDHLLLQGLGRTHVTVAASGNHDQVVTGAVGVEREPALAELLILLHQHCHATVAKDKRRTAILRRIDLASRLAVKDQCLADVAALHHTIHHRSCIAEARTTHLHVEGDARLGQTQTLLQADGGCRHTVVGGLREEHQQVDLAPVDAVILYQLFSCSIAQVGRASFAVGKPALKHAHLVYHFLHLIGRKELGVLVIVDDSRGNSGSHSADADTLKT